jgi:SAM-dependent methyltransferase
VGVLDGIMGQVRKPSGFLGQIVARGMNHAHDALTNWGLRHVEIATNFTILDIGCGGGRTIKKLATIASVGKVYGIDYSQASVTVARKVNRKLVEAGRVEIREGAVSSLPFPDGTFDLATAIESHYFWPNLIDDMKEVSRVLKHRATFLIVGEAYKGSKNDQRDQKLALSTSMTLHTIEEFGEVMREAGFSDVKVDENYQEGWICGVCRKP